MKKSKAEQNKVDIATQILDDAKDLLSDVCVHVACVYDKCKNKISSCPGAFADRIESDMSTPITDEEIRQFRGKMIPCQSNFFRPVLENGTLPTWHEGYIPVYTRVSNGYSYETCIYQGKILTVNDEQYNGLYINRHDRDFSAINLSQETDEINEKFMTLLDMLENIESCII